MKETIENKIFAKLGVDERHINYVNLKPPKKDYKLEKEHYQILSNYFYQIDLMEMPHFNKFKYLFVILNPQVVSF